MKNILLLSVYGLFITFVNNTSKAEGLFAMFLKPIQTNINTKTTNVMPTTIITDLIPHTATTEVKKPLPHIPTIKTERVLPTFNLWKYLNVDSKNVIMKHLQQSPDINYWLGKKSREQFEKDSAQQKKISLNLSIPAMFNGKVLFLNNLPAFPYLTKQPFVQKITDINVPLNDVLQIKKITPLEISDTIEFINVETPEALLKVLQDSAMIIIP